VFVGPSVRKSTKLRMLAGLKTSAKHIYIGERPSTCAAQRPRHCHVFQSTRSTPYERLRQHGLRPWLLRAKTGRLRKMFTAVFARALPEIKAEEKDIDDRVQNAAKILASSSCCRASRQLSGGHASAWRGPPSVREPSLPFDEPLSNLDAKLRVQTRPRSPSCINNSHDYLRHHDQTEAMLAKGLRMRHRALHQDRLPGSRRFAAAVVRPSTQGRALIGSPSITSSTDESSTGDNRQVRMRASKLPIPPSAPKDGSRTRRRLHGIPTEDIYDADYVAPTFIPATSMPGGSDGVDGHEVFLYLLTGGHSYIAGRPAHKAKVAARCAWWPTWITCTSSRRTPHNRALR